MARTIKDNLVFLFGQEPVLPATPVDVDHLFAGEDSHASREAGIDLAGKPKIHFLIGAGSTGKTTFARWVWERAERKDGVVPPVMIAMDPVNRDLAKYAPDTLQPKAGTNPVAFLEKLFEQLLKVKRSAVVDFGGGDTVLLKLLAETPGLHTALAEGGVEPVAMYFLSPRVSDLTPLAAVERAGFQPVATALVLNEGRTDPSRDMESWFDHIRRQPEYRKAIERGAVEVWFPKLHAAKAIEDRVVGFWQAVNHALPGVVSAAPLGTFEHRKVSEWLSRMDERMVPIASWVDL